MIKLKIPYIIREDKYYDVVLTAFESMFDELKDQVVPSGDFIRTANKEQLIPLADSYKVNIIFRRLPITRGRQLINEFPILLRGKGSVEAIVRMAQIYLGVVDCQLVYHPTTYEYDLVVKYGQIAGLSQIYIDTLYDAIRYVNPVGRRLRDVNATIEPRIFTLNNGSTSKIIIRERTLFGTRYKNLHVGKTFRDIKNYKTYPKNTNRNEFSVTWR